MLLRSAMSSSESGFGSASPCRKWGDNWCCVVTECQITFKEVFDHGLSFKSTFNEFVLEVRHWCGVVIRESAELCEPTDMRSPQYEITARALLLLGRIIVGRTVEYYFSHLKMFWIFMPLVFGLNHHLFVIFQKMEMVVMHSDRTELFIFI